MMKKNTYHVLLVEDHPFIRMSVRAAIEDCSNTYLIEEAGHYQEAIGWLERQSFNLIILDIVLPESDGYNLVNVIRESPNNTDAKILFFSSFNDTNSITKAKNMGANGFVSKDEDVSQLLLAIQATLAGYSCFPIEGKKSDIFTTQTGKTLTAQEIIIARLLAKGMNNKMIAHELTISDKTVSTHKTNILNKLGSKDKATLARFLNSAYKEI